MEQWQQNPNSAGSARCAEDFSKLPFSSQHLWRVDVHGLPSGPCQYCGTLYNDYSARAVAAAQSARKVAEYTRLFLAVCPQNNAGEVKVPPFTFEALCLEAHRTAVEKGFWDGQVPDDRLVCLAKLALIHSEVSEAAEVVRRPAPPNFAIPRADFAEELADVVIRVADLCGALNLDLDAAVAAKMARNRARPLMHGKLA